VALAVGLDAGVRDEGERSVSDPSCIYSTSITALVTHFSDTPTLLGSEID
jgi:hypothetical protein